jgi:DnaJ family protein C protein 19
LIKLIMLVVLGSIACKSLSGHWPWELMRAADRSAAEARARSLLGVPRSASREEIIEAHRRRLTQVHPDRGGSNEAVHEAAAARDLLLARLAERQLR